MTVDVSRDEGLLSKLSKLTPVVVSEGVLLVSTSSGVGNLGRLMEERQMKTFAVDH